MEARKLSIHFQYSEVNTNNLIGRAHNPEVVRSKLTVATASFFALQDGAFSLLICQFFYFSNFWEEIDGIGGFFERGKSGEVR